MVAWSAPKHYRMTDQNEEGCLQTPAGPHCAKSKQKNVRIIWKGEVSYLSACHLAVSLSWVSYHTSFERGHTGLPADIKIRTIVQLIGILWLYFGVQLGSTNEAQHFGLSLCNSLEHIRLSYLRWKKTSIAFIWGMAAWYAQRGCWVMKVVTF